MKKILLAVAILIFIGIGVFYVYKKPPQKNPDATKPVVAKPVDKVIASATFNCAEKKTIQAKFFKDKAEITLDDGKSMILPQTISGSGARYANADDSFVFWNKGDTAFIEEKGEITIKDCLVASNN